MARGECRGVSDKSYALEDIVDAFRYVKTEQKTGIVAIRPR